MIKVCKFGGTSLKDAETIKQVVQIIRRDPERKIIVVSAPGKRFSGDTKVTDLLIELAKNPNDKDLHGKIYDRFSLIVDGLNIDVDVNKELSFIGVADEDIVASGERINAKILAEYLGYNYVEAKSLLFFDDSGRFDYKKSKCESKKISLDKGIVLAGFYGDKNGKTFLFGRGGSDLTGAYISKLFNADIYENFSDVDGIKPVNPCVFKTAASIKVLSFLDFALMYALNPTVLQKSTYKPIIGTKTRIIIKNTFNPNFKGTIIKNDFKTSCSLLFSIAEKDGDIIVTGRNLTKTNGVYDTIKSTLKNKNVTFNAVKVTERIISFKPKNGDCTTIVKMLANAFFNNE